MIDNVLLLEVARPMLALGVLVSQHSVSQYYANKEALTHVLGKELSSEIESSNVPFRHCLD